MTECRVASLPRRQADIGIDPRFALIRRGPPPELLPCRCHIGLQAWWFHDKTCPVYAFALERRQDARFN